ncbi:MAG: zinc-ribbon domain-containing protein, partial [Deltaproteobacteria bacterium]
MIQVRCEGCHSAFDLDERRIPKSGMRVRCPKCASSFHVTPEGQTSALQAPGVKPPIAAAKPAPAIPVDLPVASDPAADLSSPVAPRLADLPARVVPVAVPLASTPSRGEDLPAVASPRFTDLPVPAAPRPAGPPAEFAIPDADLPVPVARGADLPVAASPRVAARPGASKGAATRLGTGPAVPARALAATIPADVLGRDLPVALHPRGAIPSPLPPDPSPLSDFGFGDIDLPPALGLD